MSERFWHGKVLAIHCYPTIATSEDERNDRIVKVLAEAQINANLEYSDDDFADLRELVSNDTLDAAILTDSGAKA